MDRRKQSVHIRLVPDNSSSLSKIERIKCRRKLKNYLKEENHFIERNKKHVMNSYFTLQKMESQFTWTTLLNTDERQKSKVSRKDFPKMVADEIFSLKSK